MGVVYSWGEHAGIVRWMPPLVWLAEWLRHAARALGRRTPSGNATEQGEVAKLLAHRPAASPSSTILPGGEDA